MNTLYIMLHIKIVERVDMNFIYICYAYSLFNKIENINLIKILT